MVLHITCDEVVAQRGGSASLNKAQGQTIKKLLAYITYTAQPKLPVAPDFKDIVLIGITGFFTNLFLSIDGQFGAI